MNDINLALQKIIDGEMKKGHTASMILGVKSGDGSLDFTGSGGSADPDSRFYIASITKMFTAAVIMQLSDGGLVDLEHPVAEYLPNLYLEGIHVHDGIDYSPILNIRQLLNHTSGLADYYENGLLDEIKDGRDRTFDVHDALEMIRGTEPPAAPDSGKAHYSDTNYQLLGAVIESVCSSPLPEVFARRIFVPLGLESTYVYGHSEPSLAPLPLYLKDRKMEFPRALSSMAPDGAIVSNTRDLLSFLRAYFAGELFASENFKSIRKFVPMFFPMQYGLGLWRFQIPRWMNLFRKTPVFLGHSGSTGSFAFYEPERDLFLAGSFNQMENPARPYQLMMKIASKIPPVKEHA
jgi:D-alanyl-D-alanine carboxypeptidase